MALISFNLRPQGETFGEPGEGKTGTRIYIAKYDAPVANINEYQTIPGLPAKYSPWDMGDNNDTFVTDRAAEYKDPGSRSILIITVTYSSTDNNGRPFGSLLNEDFQKAGGVQTGSRTYKIDSSFSDAGEAIDSPIVPNENDPWSNTKPGVLCIDWSSDKQPDGSYIVIANYSTSDEFTNTEQSENPLREPAIYKYNSIAEQKEIEVDQVTGELISYINKRQVLPLLKTQKDIATWIITRNEPFFSNKEAQVFRGATNSGAMQIAGDRFDEDQILCKSIVADELWDQENNKYYSVTYTLHYLVEGFRAKIANADFKDINGNKVADKGGFEELGTALDEQGEFILGDVPEDQRIFLEPNIYRQANLDALGL